MSVYFYAEGRSILVPKQVLLKSRYFSSLIKNEVYSDIKITAPDWMPFRSLDIYLNYLKTESIPKLEIQSIQKLLWISDYFEDLSLQSKLIQDTIPQLTRDSALMFLHDSFSKLQASPSSATWKSLFSISKDLVSQNLRYIFVNQSEQFDKLDRSLSIDIIESSLSLKYFTGLDHSALLERVRNLNEVEGNCELINKIESKIQSSPLPEVFTWASRVKSLEADIGDSQPFYIQGTRWQLSFTIKKNLLRLFFAFKSEPITENSILAVYVQVVCNDEALHKTTPKLLLLPLSVVKSSEVREVLMLSPNFSCSVRARVEFLYSALVQELVIRPESLLNESLAGFPYECLEFVLGLKQLAVRREDLVVEIIGKWTESQDLKPNEEEVEDLLRCVRWDFVSVKSLISIVSLYPVLKDYACFKKVFREELENKMSLKHARNKPRNGYKASCKEIFNNPKEYIESLAQVLLESESSKGGAAGQKDDQALMEINFSITQQENELKLLRSRYGEMKQSQDLLKSFATVGRSGLAASDGFSRVPNRIRTRSGDGKRFCVSPMAVKGQKAGVLLGTLLRKLSVQGSS